MHTYTHHFIVKDRKTDRCTQQRLRSVSEKLLPSVHDVYADYQLDLVTSIRRLGLSRVYAYANQSVM